MLSDASTSRASEKICVGIGCDRGASLQTLKTALHNALEQLSLNADCIVVFASIDKKNDEHALLQLAKNMGKSLQFYSAEQLSQVAVPSPSEVVRKYMGTPAVAEAAALLSAETNMNDLLLEKYKYRGSDGKNATVSIARARSLAGEPL